MAALLESELNRWVIMIHKRSPFLNSVEVKVLLDLLNPFLTGHLSCAFQFWSEAGYGKASQPTPVTSSVRSTFAVCRAMPRVISRGMSRSIRDANGASPAGSAEHALLYSRKGYLFPIPSMLVLGRKSYVRTLPLSH